MVLVLLLSLFLAIALIIVLRGETPIVPYKSQKGVSMHRLGVRPENAHQHSNQDPENETHFQQYRSISLDQFEIFCRKLIQHYGLTFQSIEEFGKEEFYILATLDQPIVRGNIIICAHRTGPSGVVNSATIIGFSDMVKAERAMKGVFITNGFFSEEVMKLNEGASMELIDVNQLAELIAEITPELLTTSNSEA